MQKLFLPFIALLLLAVGGSAWADDLTYMDSTGAWRDVWTVYGFGNAQALSDTLRAVGNFTESSVFKSLLGFIAVVGVLVVGLSSAFSPAIGRKFVGYLVTVFIITYAFFGAGSNTGLKVNIEVVDVADGTWKAPARVPAIIGIPASFITTLGNEFTKGIEASFMLSPDLKMSNGAPFNLVQSILSDGAKTRITDPDISSSMAYYIQDCFAPAAAQGIISPSVLLRSKDFLNDIKYENHALMVASRLIPTPGYTQGGPLPKYQQGITSCAYAHTLLKTTIDALDSDGAAGYLQNASAWARTPALSIVNAQIDAIAQYASNGGTANGGAFVKQAAVINTFKNELPNVAQATGNSEFLTNLSVAQARETQTNTWLTTAEVFNRAMGYIYAVVQVFVFAMTPLVLAAVLVPGLGMALFKNFGQILLWLSLWQPLLAIANFVVLSMQQQEMGGLFAGGGYTLGQMGMVSERTTNMRAAAMFLGTMVPVLAWSLVKGSVDFSRFIASAGGESASAQAANTQTTGNYSLNSASMDSFTANKHSIGQTGDWGHGSTMNGSLQYAQNTGGSSLITAQGAHDYRASTANSATTTTGTSRTTQEGDAASVTRGNAYQATSALSALDSRSLVGSVASAVATSFTASQGASGNASFDLMRKGGGGHSKEQQAVFQKEMADLIKSEKSGSDVTKAMMGIIDRAGLNLAATLGVAAQGNSSETKANQALHQLSKAASATEAQNNSKGTNQQLTFAMMQQSSESATDAVQRTSTTPSWDLNASSLATQDALDSFKGVTPHTGAAPTVAEDSARIRAEAQALRQQAENGHTNTMNQLNGDWANTAGQVGKGMGAANPVNTSNVQARQPGAPSLRAALPGAPIAKAVVDLAQKPVEAVQAAAADAKQTATGVVGWIENAGKALNEGINSGSASRSGAAPTATQAPSSSGSLYVASPTGNLAPPTR